MKCEKDCFEKKRVVIESWRCSVESCLECPRVVKQLLLNTQKEEKTPCWLKYLKWVLLGVVLAVVVLLVILGNGSTTDTPAPAPSESPTELPFELKQVEVCWSEEPIWTNTTAISVPSHSCNNESDSALDLSGFKYLESFTVGDKCFMYVEELKLIGLEELESVVIGYESFAKSNDIYVLDPDRHLYVKNCPKLKTLRIDAQSFHDYSVCEIENVDALEVIEFGYANDYSNNFRFSSLELKSSFFCS